MYTPKCWKPRTYQNIKSAAIRGLRYELAHNKAMLATPDDIELVLDSEGVEQPWNATTVAAIAANIAVIEAELAALE